MRRARVPGGSLRPASRLAMSALALLLAAPLPAGASGRGASGDWSVGGDLGLLMRQEAGGQRAPLLAVGPRVELALGDFLRAGAAYGFSWSAGNPSELAAATQLHRGSLRLDAGIRLRAAFLFVGAGGVLSFQHTTLRGGTETLSATAARVGLLGGGGVEVDLSPVTVRFGLDGQWLGERVDLVTGVGVLFRIASAQRGPR